MKPGENLLDETKIYRQIREEWRGMSRKPFDEKTGARLAGALFGKCRERDKMSLTGSELSDLTFTMVDRMMFHPVTNLELFLTENCNLRCDYCFVKRKNNHLRMSLETGLKAIDFLFEYSYDQADLHVIFFGGEPLLEYENVQKLIEYSEKRASAAGKDVSFSMTSNALLLDEEKISWLNSHELMVLLSIDGIEHVHDRHRVTPDGKGSFRRIMEKIPMLKRTQGWLGSRMTVLPDSVDFLFDGVRVLADAGINQFILGLAHSDDWTIENIEILRRRMLEVAEFARRRAEDGDPIRVSVLEHDLKEADAGEKDIKWGCYAGKNSVAVSTDGWLYPCSRFEAITEHESDSEFVLGHVDSGFRGNSNREIFIDLEKKLENRCGGCSMKVSCHGGCPALNHEATGDMAVQPSSECLLHGVVEEVFTRYGEYMDLQTCEKEVAAGKTS